LWLVGAPRGKTKQPPLYVTNFPNGNKKIRKARQSP
jgi:hypothetical protein